MRTFVYLVEDVTVQCANNPLTLNL